MAKNKKEVDGFERAVIIIGLGSYFVIAAGILIQSLFALSVVPPLDAFMPLIYWLLIGVVFLIGWTTLVNFRFLIAMLPLLILAIGLFAGLGQLGRDIEASAPPDVYHVYPSPIPGTPIPTNVQPDGPPITEEQKKWLGEKYTFDPRKEAGRVLMMAYIATVIAFLLNILTKNKLKLQFIFLGVWALMLGMGLFIPADFNFYMGYPSTDRFPDAATSFAAKELWRWGATQSIIWMIFNQIFNLVLRYYRQGAGKLGRGGAIFSAATTWGITMIVFAVIRPETITMYLATNYAHNTALSVNVAMSLIWSGQFTFIAANGAYMTIKNMIFRS